MTQSGLRLEKRADADLAYSSHLGPFFGPEQKSSRSENQLPYTIELPLELLQVFQVRIDREPLDQPRCIFEQIHDRADIEENDLSDPILRPL